MHTPLRIATLNINWGGEPKAPACDGEPRLTRLVPWLSGLNADLLILTEFKDGPLGDELKERLAEQGYPHVAGQVQPAYKLGVLAASRQPLSHVGLPIPATMEPWRSTGIRLAGIDVFGFYFPLGEAKERFWDWLLANAQELQGRDVLLAGDFNTGKIRIDEAGETFDCQDRHEALEALGFVDTWRSAFPKGRDYTWYSPGGNGFRLDYIWASGPIASRVQRVCLEHESRLALLTDHSAVVADIG